MDTEKIGINLWAIHRRCRLGGIRKLSFLGSSGETSSYTPTIVGHTPDGTAYAGKVGKAHIEPTFSSSSSKKDFDPLRLSETHWADVTVKMNTSEALERISARKMPVRSPKEWTKEINNALQQSILREGSKILMGDNWTRLRALFGGLGYLIPPFRLIEIPIFIMTNMLINTIFKVFYRKYGGDVHNFRTSVFYAIQPDRIALLYGLTKKEKILGTEGSLVRALS